MTGLPDVLPVILAGGQGRRLWPLTGPHRPKPFLKVRRQSLLRMTASRVPWAQAPVVITGHAYADAVSEHCPVKPQQIFLEPEGRGTAPAIAAVAHYFRRSDPLLLVMPCDHLIDKPEVLCDAVLTGKVMARTGAIVMFGVKTRRAATGYGYIRHEENKVVQFVEKPDRATARRFIKERWLWNSGIFLFTASAFLDRLRALDPVLHDSSLQAVSRAARRQNFVLLDADAFRACPSISIDRAVMEKDGLRSVIPVDMGWRDLGSRASYIAGLLRLPVFA